MEGDSNMTMDCGCDDCWHRYQRSVLAIAASYFYCRRRKRRRRRFWVGKDLKTREQKGEYHVLVRDLRFLRVEKCTAYFRMNPETFYELLGCVKDSITKITTNMRKPISAEERLGVTLQFLAHGGTYTNLATRYRMSKTILSKIVPETCRAIWDALQPVVMPTPNEDMWKKISDQFDKKCQFPNCMGAIDGKHIQIRAPKNSGSMYFNYKKTYSIVLLGVADANYKFVVVDVGGFGKCSDSKVLQSSKFGSMLMDGSLALPADKVLPGQLDAVPPVFIGDEAFPLKPNLVRPFSSSSLDTKRSIFNYRLSRARRVVEMTFGILVARFRVLYGRIDTEPERVDSIVKACTVLHNFLCDKKVCSEEYALAEDGSSQSRHAGLIGLQRVGRPGSQEAMRVREAYANYFVSDEGSVPWQSNYVARTS